MTAIPFFMINYWLKEPLLYKKDPLTGSQNQRGCFLNTGSKDAGSVDAKTFLMHGFRKDEGD
ncbi:hypothetical protein M885DRAFT_570814 [Pelagophyceae sp. CCMP2097]|nr:hypothetical protein M885DRAFT_570814 [Pelagophyceae sp. CCMP2097]